MCPAFESLRLRVQGIILCGTPAHAVESLSIPARQLVQQGEMLHHFPVARDVLRTALLSWGTWQIEIYKAASWSIVQISFKSSALLVTPGQMSSLPRGQFSPGGARLPACRSRCGRAGAAGKRWEAGLPQQWAAQGGAMCGNARH